MTQSFINPLSKFTSDTLRTLPYSRLYFFENESSTPKEVFKDKAKTISWGVYAEADSAGNFPPIWYDGICRATLKWSSNWLTDPVGTVQTAWPIDHIGTDQTFDTDITVAGDLTAENIYSTGVVQAAGNAGFKSDTYTLSARNPIWSFTSSPGYGISYFAGATGIGIDDKIGFHFGTATLLSSEFTFDDDGNFAAIGSVAAPVLSSPTGNIVTVNSTTVNASNGVSVGNSANASPTALDWYLEGSFVPTIKGLSTAGVGTYTLQIGRYTRIGNVVFFSATIGWSAHTGTGAMQFSGLPISVSYSGCAAISYDSIVVGAGKTISVQLSSTNGTFFADDPAGGVSSTISIDTAGTINITGHYFV